MKIGSLFSGILGIDLALEQEMPGASLAWACEIEPFPRKLIRARRPGARLHRDVRKLHAGAGIVCDVLTGGFPCQDVSVAGNQVGIEGARSGLWTEMHRIIEAARPRWVLIENVRNLRNLGLDVVLADLARIGYDAEWQTVQALAAGALHRRARMFIVAYPHVDGAPVMLGAGLTAAYGAAFWRNRAELWSSLPCAPTISAQAIPPDVRRARLKALGNAVCPQQVAPILAALAGPGEAFEPVGLHSDGPLPYAGVLRAGAVYERPLAVPTALADAWHAEWRARFPAEAAAVLPRREARPGDASSLYPTPSAADYGSSQNGSNADRPSAGTPSLSTMARMGLYPTPTARDGDGGPADPERRQGAPSLRDAMLWPTPMAHDMKGARSEASKADGGGATLTDVARLWPTPCTTDSASAARHTTTTDVMHPGTTLTDAARLWATPCAADSESSGSMGAEMMTLTKDARLRTGATGHLNPEFVAWLMGFPSGWFDGTSAHDAQMGLFR